MNRDELLALIEARLDELNKSAAEISNISANNPYLIRNMRKGRDAGKEIGVPNFEHLQALCRALDLEFYIGRRREHHPTVSGEWIPLPEFSLEDFSHGAEPSLAGAPLGSIAFDREWLDGNEVAAEHSCLLRVSGDAMKPTIPDQALALVELSRRAIDHPGVFAFVADGHALVRRLVRSERSGVTIIADNRDYPPVSSALIGKQRLHLIGQVRFVFSNTSPPSPQQIK